jgi:hypothetical protein
MISVSVIFLVSSHGQFCHFSLKLLLIVTFPPVLKSKYFALKKYLLFLKEQDTVCLPLSWKGKKILAENAQGIEAEIPQALPQVKPRNWSGKPGLTTCPSGQMRPK